MGTSVSIYKLLVLHIVFLLSSLCSATTIPQPSGESMGACYCPIHLRSSDARGVIFRHQDTRDSITSSPGIAPGSSKRNPPTTNELPHHAFPLTERGSLSDSVPGGYKMVWRYVEVIINSTQAYHRHRRIYEKILQEIEPPASAISNVFEAAGTLGRLVITYGSLRLMIEHLPGDHNALDNALDIIQDFAVEMLSICTVAMTYGVYQLAIVAAKTVILISLGIVDLGPVPELIGH